MSDFNKYLSDSRRDFAAQTAKYPVSEHLELRTQVDTFLIAFDQACSVRENPKYPINTFLG